MAVFRSGEERIPILLDAEDEEITILFSATFSCDCESYVISDIKVTSVSEPAPLALFGLGLAALGYIRRRRAI